jgi:hypothetical protein
MPASDIYHDGYLRKNYDLEIFNISFRKNKRFHLFKIQSKNNQIFKHFFNILSLIIFIFFIYKIIIYLII